MKQVQTVIDKWIMPQAKKLKCDEKMLQGFTILSKSAKDIPKDKIPASLPSELEVWIAKVQSKDEMEPEDELWNYDSLCFLYLNVFHQFRSENKVSGLK